MSDRWRGVVAALLNPDLRIALGEVIGEGGLSDAQRERALARLRDIGLVRDGEDGVVFDADFVRGILDENPVVRPTGPERFLDGDGRIDRYPVQASERQQLLQWVAERAFVAGEVLDERQANERLARFTDDTAALRRFLVDAAILERTRSGSEYALARSDS